MNVFPFLRTVRAQMTSWNVLVLTVVLLTFGGVLRVSLEHNLVASVDRDIRSQAKRAQSFWGHWSEHSAEWTPQPSSPPPGRLGQRGSGPPSPFPSQTNFRTPSQWHSKVVEKHFDLQGRRILSSAQEPPLDISTIGIAGQGQERYSTV